MLTTVSMEGILSLETQVSSEMGGSYRKKHQTGPARKAHGYWGFVLKMTLRGRIELEKKARAAPASFECLIRSNLGKS